MSQQEIPEFLKRLLPAGQAVGQAAIGGLRGFPQPPHISIRGQRFHLVDAQGIETTLQDININVCVVDANENTSRMFYGRPYNPDEEALPPKCFSDNGVGPSSMAMEPQHTNCAACPKAKWGSATSNLTGKGIPACQERKKLAVLYEGNLYRLEVPPGSTGKWKEYFELIARMPTVSITMLFTEVSFDPKSIGVLNFRPAAFLDEETAEKVWQITNNKDLTVKLIGADDVALQDFSKLPKPVEGKPLPLPRITEPLKPIEERIVTLPPTISTGDSQDYQKLDAAPRVAGVRQQLEQSVQATEPPVEKPKRAKKADLPKSAPEASSPALSAGPAFGMTPAATASTDEQLNALLANAVGFAKKQ